MLYKCIIDVSQISILFTIIFWQSLTNFLEYVLQAYISLTISVILIFLILIYSILGALSIVSVSFSYEIIGSQWLGMKST